MRKQPTREFVLAILCRAIIVISLHYLACDSAMFCVRLKLKSLNCFHLCTFLNIKRRILNIDDTLQCRRREIRKLLNKTKRARKVAAKSKEIDAHNENY